MEVTIFTPVWGFRKFSKLPMEVTIFIQVWILGNLAKDIWKLQSLFRFRGLGNLAKDLWKLQSLLGFRVSELEYNTYGSYNLYSGLGFREFSRRPMEVAIFSLV